MDTPHVELREPRADEWAAILDLANLSVSRIAGGPSQNEWMSNRRRPHPLRRQVVAVQSGALVGYAAVESRFEEVERGFRLFLVTQPDRLDDIGVVLASWVEDRLRELDAAEAWFVEYAEGRRLLAFLSGLGYRETRRFRLDEAVEAVVSAKRLPGTRTPWRHREPACGC